MPLYAFDARRSYLNGYYAANFAVPGTNEVGKRLGAYDARRRYLSGRLGDDIALTDMPISDTLTPPVYSSPDLPLILVPSSAGDTSMMPTSSTLTPPSSGSPASVIAAGASAAQQLAARNQAAIVNPTLLRTSATMPSASSIIGSIFSTSNPNLPMIALAIAGVALLSGGKKRR
jgi:hypothetical protein